MAMPKLPEGLRAFDDPDAARKLIYDNALEAVQNRFPVEDDHHILELKDAHYDGPQHFNLDQQKQALMRDRQLRTPIKGTWRLLDKASGAVLDQKEDVVMHVPYYTPRGTFINNGNEYSIVNQSRLKPGAYVRKQRTGEVETHFNVSPGSGKSFRLHLEPETGIMRINIDQSKIPVYPLLKTLGVTDQELTKAWGPELVAVNAAKADARAMQKIYQRISGYKYDASLGADAQAKYLQEALPKFEVDPHVVARTMGMTGVTGVTPQLLVRATQKMLNVSKGHEESDDRDAPMFSNIYSVEDMIKERIDKDAGRLSKNLLWKIRRSKNLQPVQRGALNPYIHSLMQGSGLAMPLEETNPLSTLEQMHRITKLGEGGISSAESVTDEARDVNNGQMGFIDPITGPEGLNIGIDVRASYRTFKGKDKQLYAEFKEPRSGKEFYLRPDEVADKVLAFPGQMQTEGDTAVAMVKGKISRVPKDQVDYEVPSMAHTMSPNSNLVPVPTGLQPGRAFYASKFFSQYLPQVKGEVPLVDSLTPDGSSTFTEHYGRQIGTLKSPVGGTVIRVTDTGVTVKGDDGKTHNVETVKDFPFNRITAISYYPTVRAGDKINVGDMVAHSNFTDAKTGALNMGVNLKTAMSTARGKSVSGDTPVLTATSSGKYIFGPIRDVHMECGLRAPAMATSPMRHQMLDIYAYMAHEADSDMCLVTTLDGMSIKTTRSHSFVELDASGTSLVPVRPDDMVLGITAVPVIQPVLPHSESITTVDMVSTFGKGRPLSVRADYEFGVITGLYIAEGCVRYLRGTPHDVSIACVEPEIIAYVQQWCKKYGLHSRVYHRVEDGGSHHGSVTICSAALATWFSYSGRYAWGKKIPDETWTATKDFSLGLISGYWSGDGTVSHKQCTATTTSKLLADGICFLLGSLGVRATYREYGNGVLAKRPAYQIHVFREFLDRFPAVLLGYKQHAIEALKLQPVSFSRDRIPIPRMYRRAVDRVRGTQLAEKGYVSRQILRKHYCDLPQAIQALVDARVWWDIVESVVPCPNEAIVYDLDMRPLSNFAVGQGWVVHNSYEDAYVISAAAAKKLATDQLFGFDQEARHGVHIGKSKYMSTFPTPFTKEQFDKIGDDGVIIPGSIVNKGDPIILAVGPKMLTSADAQLGKLHKVLRNAFTDKVVTWDHNYPGVITDATTTPSGARVNVKTQPPVQVGDKLSGRFGLKGVVGSIIDDDKMPRDLGTNEPFDLLLNPMGIQSRVAPGQIIEMTLSKVAKATGKQIRIPQTPPPEGWAAWAKKQMDAAGVKEDTDMFDPESGKTIKSVGDGHVYISAFHHLAEKKLSQRGESGAYTIDEQPSKGGSEGAKRFSSMDVGATLAHGATAVVHDAINIRGNKSEDFWKALKLGQPLPAPKTPFIYTKFLNTLKAGGINIHDKGGVLSLLPMTDKDVDVLSKGDIGKPDMITHEFEPIPGGLFDVGKTGGMAGNRWTAIKLNEPLPNPVMEEPIRRVLGLKVKELHDVVAGRMELNGLTGGRALQEALKSIDIDKAIEDHKDLVRTTRGANRDNAIKVLGYLTSVKSQGLHPADWMITKVPVLPPVFRPISRMGDIALQTDLNELYRDIIETNNNIHELRKDLPESELHAEKATLYDAVTAAYGLGDPITPEGQSKRLKGAIRQVIGVNPKTGLFQSKVISKTVGNVARGVVTPDPNLDMDSVGIPADTAWTLYKDFVTRRLVRKGYPATRALELIDKRSPEAREMLDAEMQERPVIMDRAPTWHKFNLMAFHPHIVEGHIIRTSPLITKGYTMDHDGDQVNMHVPISDKAVEQTLAKMMPSKNLTSLTDLRTVRHAPSMEMTLGLYQLTQPASTKPPKVFATAKDARHAYEDGLIKPNDPIIIQHE